MGTNYYKVIPVSKKDKVILHEKLELVLDGCGDGYELNSSIEKLLKKTRIHICKFSAGWQVCFDHNWGKYYNPDKESLEIFLREPGSHIEDEYGKVIEYDEFWSMVDDHNQSPNNTWTSKSYREYEKKMNGKYLSTFCLSEIEKCERQFKVNCYGETDFTVDGLRFAVYSDFS